MGDTERIVQEKLENEDLESPKSPRKIIHFSSGETMEEYSTEEEEDDAPVEFRKADTSSMSWGPYLQFWALRIATASFFTCEFLGGKLATLFGLNVPKYQYAVDEYSRRQAEDSDDEDGQVTAQSQVSQSLAEQQRLEAHGMEYGAIPLTDRAAVPLASTVLNIDETKREGFGYQNISGIDAN
ncbi:protein FAM177B isoform X2 [Pleurodeles waltl]|uniref:protein FAM177B isoform X2 n=1 Tax=Pleurodeles waltl TaxID=8319 RepID=UPI0037096252